MVRKKKASSSKNWQLINAAQPKLSRQEQIRYAWYGQTGPHPFWIIFFYILSFFVLIFLLSFSFTWPVYIAVVVSLVSAFCLSYLVNSFISLILKIHRQVVVVAESGKIFVFKADLKNLNSLQLISELDGLHNTFGPYEGYYTRDQVSDKKMWISRKFYPEVEAANRRLLS